MQYNDLAPGAHFMVAIQGTRGHFACEMWMNNVDLDIVFPEPWSSDSETYGTHAEAVAQAKLLAQVLSIPYVE